MDDEFFAELGLIKRPTGRFDFPDLEDTTFCELLEEYTAGGLRGRTSCSPPRS